MTDRCASGCRPVHSSGARACLSADWLILTLFLGTAATVCGAAPPNDDFAGRIILSGTNLQVTASNIDATKEPGEPDHASDAGGRSVWWAWIAPDNGEAYITTGGSSFDTLLAVYTGASVSSLSLVASDDDHGALATSRVRIAVTRDTQYEIAVDGYSGASGSIALSLLFISEPITRPPNDQFAQRTLLQGSSVTTNGSNVNATREPGEPDHAGRLADSSVWWSWTAGEAGRVTITTGGSSFDTLLAVYSGSTLSNLNLVAANDDADTGAGDLTSVVTFDATAGMTCQIAVDGYDGVSGLIVLGIRTASVRLSAPERRPDGTFQFILTGPAGSTNEIEASADLMNWTPVGTVVDTSGTLTFTDSTATNSQKRFYRAILK